MFITAQVFVDVVMVGFICYNAFAQEREQASLVHKLYKDGVDYFLIAAGIRAVNLILAISVPIWLLALVSSVTWPCLAVNLFHFTIRLRQRWRHEQEREGRAHEGASSIELRNC
ncbi:hypothetical protein JB92DRAFT_2937771 [Gautieria morchelliformis]|nr:hypothetical protein JB92DRAFT_2937771 [Gautieria morchelliformis]